MAYFNCRQVLVMIVSVVLITLVWTLVDFAYCSIQIPHVVFEEMLTSHYVNDFFFM